MFWQGLRAREIEIEIEIGIGIEIENLQNDPIRGKYGERLGNLQPPTKTRYRKFRSYASDFEPDPDTDFDLEDSAVKRARRAG